MSMIVKRDNKLSPVQIKEIRDALEWASRGLDLNYLELESHVDSIYTDKITTMQIQRSLINIALQLTTVERPQWRFMAGRLLLMELYKEVKHGSDTDTFGYGDYVEYLKRAARKGLYDDKIFTLYSEEELQEAAQMLKPEYDFDYDYAGVNQLMSRYLIKDGNKFFELPQYMYLTVSLYLGSNEDKENRLLFVKNCYEMIATRKISLATPILINLRKKEANLSSCFITAVDDSLDSIFYNISTIARISKNGGGVGVCLSRIRALGSQIKGTPGASGGVIPWIRIINDTAVGVNQLGKRAGAVTVALDIWHLDVMDFLELQTENGDQRKKAYDIFPQLVIPDLFLKRVKDNQVWTLFDPYEVRRYYGVDFASLWGDEFEALYADLEKDERITLRKEVSAKELFIKILKTAVETGMPYMFFKDTANRTNPNLHDGMIGCGNLCQESFSNFKPARVNPSTLEGETVINKADEGLIHTCNLVSLNLANLLDPKDLNKASRLAVRILDNTIDLTYSPVLESNVHNNRYRTIGIGAMGLADYLAFNKVAFEKSAEVVDELFEDIAYNVIDESATLAVLRGSFPAFKGSLWDQGIIMGKDAVYFDENVKNPGRWRDLIGKIKKGGLRNSQLLAIAPNTSSALVQGCTPGVLPVFSKFHIDKNSTGTVPKCPPYLREAFWYYKENKHIDQREVVDVIARIQKWIDQGISFELLFNLNLDIRATDIYDTIIKAWENGCKTIYYTRTIQKNSSDAVYADEGCVSCAN